MKISVIIPARNEEDVIATCIQNCLNKGKKPHEIIVVNDGSTDRTQDIVEVMKLTNPEIKLITFGRGHSAAFARNKGAELATGDILFFLDSDMELVTQDYIDVIEREFGDSQLAGACLEGKGEYKTFLQKCQQVRVEISCYKLRKQNKTMPYVSIVKSDIFGKVGGYDESIFYYEDRDFMTKVRLLGDIRMIPVMTIHKEPSTMDEFMRQSRYVGKGIAQTFNLAMPWDLPLAYRLTGNLLPSIVYIFILQPIRLLTIIYSILAR